MADIINKIIHICQSTSIFKDTLADLSLQELLVKIVQPQTLKEVNGQNNKTSNPYLSEVINVIRENITHKTELKTIANKAGMSTSSLYRLFKNELGISPVEFIILEKIKRAIGLAGSCGLGKNFSIYRADVVEIYSANGRNKLAANKIIVPGLKGGFAV